MKSPLIVSVLALAVSLVALATVLVRSSASGAREQTASRPDVAADPDADLVARLDSLLLENRELQLRISSLETELRGRIAALEIRPEMPTRTPVGEEAVSAEELESLRNELRDALAAGRIVSPDSPAFQERVADTIVNLERDRAVEESKAHVEARSNVLKEKLSPVAEKLGLSYQQESLLQHALETHYVAEAQYPVLHAEGMPREDIGKIAAEDYKALAESLTSFLTPEQLTAYLSLQQWHEEPWLFPVWDTSEGD